MEIAMALKILSLVLASSLAIGQALADDDCSDPVASWKPREQLRQLLVEQGWDVKRIQVREGCYLVKGYDANGHRMAARFRPASFRALKLEVEFNDSASTAEYLDIESPWE
jgi:hypothetical protein